jgi:hypothetical protein
MLKINNFMNKYKVIRKKLTKLEKESCEIKIDGMTDITNVLDLDIYVKNVVSNIDLEYLDKYILIETDDEIKINNQVLKNSENCMKYYEINHNYYL